MLVYDMGRSSFLVEGKIKMKVMNSMLSSMRARGKIWNKNL